METAPIIEQCTSRSGAPNQQHRSKSPSHKQYSHLLYLSEQERQLYASRLVRSSTSSLRSSESIRSRHSVASSTRTNSTSQTSQMSIHSPRYVDDHYPLITTIHPETLPSTVSSDHAALWCARRMAQIHNIIIRALNSSWNHAISIQPDTQEASDFLLYNQQFYNTLEQHQNVEDNYSFPAFNKLSKRTDASEENSHGHKPFTARLTLFQKYVFITKPSEYHGPTFRHIIESFAPALVQHLHDEISDIVKLHVVDSKDLVKVWRHAERLTARDNSLYTDLPFMLGCQDKDFLIDGRKCDFPEVSWLAEALVRNWHAKKHAGVWSFCPSDLSGNRRLLPMANERRFSCP